MNAKAYLTGLGWTAETARERQHESLKYAREAKANNWNRSYIVLFVELAYKYRNYCRILSH